MFREPLPRAHDGVQETFQELDGFAVNEGVRLAVRLPVSSVLVAQTLLGYVQDIRFSDDMQVRRGAAQSESPRLTRGPHGLRPVWFGRCRADHCFRDGSWDGGPEHAQC